MSENNSNQVAGSCGPACEGESLIIEVMGRDHPEGHSFRIFDDTNYEQQEWLENQVQVEPLEDSVLHVWPWRGQPSRNIWIEIEADGSPIRVPFLKGAAGIDREIERQRHVILPVVPATLISGVELHGSNPVHHVLARAGFLYLFHEGKLWRELEIQLDESGVTRYYDVALTEHRANDGKLRAGYRDVTGTGLEEIWLPARIGGGWLNLQAAYSESQWPGERVNHLERSDRDRSNRCNLIRMQLDTDRKEDVANLRVSNGNTTAFLAQYLEPQRPRKPALEWQFDRPEKYLLDLDGIYHDTAMRAAVSMHQRQEDPDPEDPVAEDERPEMTALSNCLHNTLQELNLAEAESPVEGRQRDPEPFSWDGSESCVADCTEQAKTRGIGAIRLDDPVYQLRYNQRRRQVAAWFMNAAVRRARFRPYFDSALLVHSVIEPELIGSEPNPLHKHISEVNRDGRVELERSLSVSERAMARRYLDRVHTELLERLSDERTHHVLTDLFTHSSYDYAGAFNFVTSLVMNLVTEPAECDALDVDVEGAVDGQGKRWLEGLCEGRHSQVLHSLLFPRFQSEDLEKPYEAPAEPKPNHGNGRFRETDLAAMAEMDLPDIDDLKTMDGLELAVEAAAGAFETVLTTGMRIGGQALMGVHGNMLSAIHHASLAIQARNTELAGIRKELEDLRAQKADLENRRWAIERRINNLSARESELKEIREQLLGMDARYQELDAQRKAIGKSAIQGRMRLYAGALEQLRRSLPIQLGKLELNRLSKALQKDYFVFKISSELITKYGSKPAIALFGDMVQQGLDDVVQASTNKKRSRAAGITSDVAEDVYILAIPRTEAIAERLEKISAAESRFREAVSKLEALEGALDNAPNTPAAAAAIAARKLDAAKQELDTAERELKAFERDSARVNGREQYVSELEAANDAANRVDQAEISSKRSSRLYRVLNKPVFPVFVGLMELHNTSSVWSGTSYQARVKGSSSANVKMFSAGADLLAASAAISERWVLGPSKILSLRLPGSVGEVFAKRFGAPLTIRSGLGAAAGFLMALDAGLDAYYEYRMGNTGAAIGYGLLAGSGVAFGFASLVGKSGLLLVLGPKGWLVAGVVLAVAGLATVLTFSDEPLDIWMRHGPFGPLNEKPFLKEPDEAYYRLISLLMGVSVRLEYNPLRRAAREGELDDERTERLIALSNAGERLVIESAIPGLFHSSGFIYVIPKLQLTESIAVSKGRSGHVQTNRIVGEDVKQYCLWMEKSDLGLHIYLNAPANERRELETRFWEPDAWETRIYRWQAKVQMKARKAPGHSLMVFPAPPPEDPLVFDEGNELHGEPDFSRNNQPFWYSQRVQENVE